MEFLLELKENIRRIYSRFDKFIVPAIRFFIALVSFLMLNSNIGYMAKIKNPLIAIILSIVCAFLPSWFTIFILSIFMLLHLYAVSIEFTIVALCVILVMYLMFFRFSSKYGYLLIATVLLCWMKIPAAIPVVAALGFGMVTIVPVAFGVIIFSIIETASQYEAAITNASASDSVQQISYIAESFVSNKTVIVMVVAFSVTIIVVNCIKRLSINNSWLYAIIAGIVVELLFLIIGILAFDAKINILVTVLGAVLGVIVGYICKMLLFNVDFKRTEFVQYEDDEYYYYVKAVPKITIANTDVKVKQINARKTKKSSKTTDSYSDMTNDDDDDYIV